MLYSLSLCPASDTQKVSYNQSDDLNFTDNPIIPLSRHPEHPIAKHQNCRHPPILLLKGFVFIFLIE